MPTRLLVPLGAVSVAQFWPGFTPLSLPMMEPATWVPWPWLSSQPVPARPDHL